MYNILSNHAGSGGGGGGVSSVGVNVDSTTSAIFANTANKLTNSPITSSGVITMTLSTQVKNTILCGPTTGSDAAPAFRVLVGADLPNPSSSTLGGIQSYAAVSNQWIRSISTSGVPASSQPAFTDISGSVASTQMPALTSDVTTSAGAVATTVAKIQGTTVSGTTGTGNVVFSASPTLTGTAVLASATFSGSAKNGNYVMSAGVTAAGNSGTTLTIDLSAASITTLTLTGNCTLTLSNPVTGGTYVIQVNTGAGSLSLTWPGTVKNAPTVTQTASKVDIYFLWYDGTNYWMTYNQGQAQ